jgi:hypothetical protein
VAHKTVKRIATGMLAALLVLSGLVWAQSLGDVARQEKERQKKNEQSGVKARTFTEDDLAANKGRLANDPAAPSADGAKASSTSGDPGSGAARLEEESAWRQRVAQATARVEKAQQRYDELAGMTMVPDMHYVDPQGRVVIGSVQQLQAMTAQAKAALDAAKKAKDDLLESARRQGVPPGWLR